MPQTISPPQSDEYADFYRGYIANVSQESDAIAVLVRQEQAIANMRRLTPAQAGYRYALDKWSVRDVIGHLTDSERIFSYRLLRIARGDQTPLAGFDEVAYAAMANADGRALEDLVDELATVRRATLLLVRALDEASLSRRGTANNWSVTVRGIAYVIPGHFQHHVNVLRERYDVHV